ncbi:MAG: GEVED domain-containing protein [Flavobacteriales bacterium]
MAALLAIGGSLLWNPSSATSLVTENFEGATPFLTANSASNFWFIGTATNNGGTKGAYITNNAGATNGYGLTTQVANHLYVPITVPAGESAIVLSFDWRGLGEFDAGGTWDYLRVSVTSAAPVAGTLPALADQIAVIYAGQDNYTKAWINLPPGLAGAGPRFLVFTWTNDTSLGSGQPAAIDNVSLTSAIPAPLMGPVTLTIPGTYSTIGEAFANANAHGVNTAGGSVNFDVAAGAVFTETPPMLLVSGSSATNRVVFRKSGAGANPMVVAEGSGNSGGPVNVVGNAVTTALGASLDAIIALHGCDFVTFSSIDVQASTTVVATPFMNVDLGYLLRNNRVALNVTTIDGCQNNIIEGCKVTMDRRKSTAITTASDATNVPGSSTPTLAAHANSGNIFRDFFITNCVFGMNLLGNATVPDIGQQITTASCTSFNTVGDPAIPGDISGALLNAIGIQSLNQSTFTVKNTRVSNVRSTGTTTVVRGMALLAAIGTCEYSNNDFRTLSRGTSATLTKVSALFLTHSTTVASTTRVFNNTMSEILNSYTGAASVNRGAIGLDLVSATTGSGLATYEIYDNAVSLDQGSSLLYSSACFEIGSTSGPLLIVKNNIFSNRTAAQGATAKHFGIVSPSATSLGNGASSYTNNDIYIPNDLGVSGHPARGNTTNYNSVALWQASNAQATGNLTHDPVFVDPVTNLHSGAAANNGAGVAPPAYITVDQACATRTPDNDIGAFIINSCTGTPSAGAISGPTSVCSGFGTTLSFTGETGLGISYQWFTGPAGGPWTTPLGTGGTQATGPIVGSAGFVVTTTCSFGGGNSTSSEWVVSNPNCNDGDPCTIDACSGGVCSNTPGTPPSIASTTATPTTVCAGGTSQLQVNLTPPATYCTVGQTTGVCASDEYFTNVTFLSINNPSGCSLPVGYENFTGISTNVTAGSIGNAMTVTIANFLAGEQFRVWFDWNQNGLFTDAGEEYSPTVVANPTSTFSINVPANAISGNTRMRVRVTFTGIIPPCGITNYGETEDYTVNVVGGASYSYLWDHAAELDNPNISGPIATPIIASTTYGVAVTLAGCTSNGSVMVTRVPAATANAGGPYSACGTSPVNISATANGAGSWSGGAGMFGTPSSASTTYTPDISEVGTAVMITWTTTGTSPCPNVPSNATVNVSTPATANAGGPYTTCVDEAVNITATASGTGIWSGGAGTFGTPSSLSTTYTPDVSESGSVVVITWTTDDPDGAGACGTVASNANVTVNALPVPVCGSYGPACVTDADILLGGSPSGGTWTGTGVVGAGPYSFDPSAGTQILTYSYTDGNGCTGTCQTTITVANTCNDLCTNAIALSCNSVISGSTVGTNPDAVPTCTGTTLNTAGGVWYTVVGTGGNITASLCGSSYDSEVGVFTTPDCVAFTCVAGNNNFCALNGQVTFASTLGQTYYILVTGFGAATGSYTLQVVCNGDGNCNDNGVKVEIRTDNFGSETSWEVTPIGNTVPVCSGSGYADNATISIDCCLLDGCYTLSFFDVFGDAMSVSTPAGMGGYRLVTATGKRIIDNWNDGQDFDNPSPGGFTSRVANGFCVPIGATQLTIATCDKENWGINDVIVSGIDPAVSSDYPNPLSGYQFWVYNPDGGYSRRLYRAHGANSCIGSPSGPTLAAHLRLSCLNSSLPNLPCDTLLNVRVRPRLNGAYGEFGPACRLKVLCTPQTCPTTKLDDNPLHAGTTLSCNVTGKVVGASGNAGKLFPNIVSGANKYQYEFVLLSEGYTRTIATPTGSYALTLANWATSPLICGTFIYDVRVRVSFDGGMNYCPYGPVCTVGITNNPPNNCTAPFQGGGGQNSMLVDEDGMTLWPNPVRNGNVTLNLNGLNSDVMTASVDIFDMFGKKVMTTTLATDGAAQVNTVLELKDLATGMYTVNVISGSQSFTNRLVIE